MSVFDELSPGDGSLASMDISWLPNRFWSMITLVSSAFLLVWGSMLNGRSFGPVRAILVALPYGDKVGHFTLYGTITFALAMMAKSRNQKVAIGIGVIALGIGDEFRQLLEANRNFSISDVLANVGGVSLGLLAVLLVARIVDQKTQSLQNGSLQNGA